MLELITNSPEETRQMGRAFGRCCLGGENLLLHGTLGAGKTCFLQGVARGLDVPEQMEVVSPTFVLHCQYEGRLLFNHIDAYRLEGANDIPDLGFEEYYSDKKCVNAIEWAEILEGNLPVDCLEIEIEPRGETKRAFTFRPSQKEDAFYNELLQKFTALNRL